MKLDAEHARVRDKPDRVDMTFDLHSAPPILFIDFRETGFLEAAMFERDRKSIEMFHTPRIHTGDRHRTRRVGIGWTMTEHRDAAVWDKGFTAFLDAPNELDEVLARLAGSGAAV